MMKLKFSHLGKEPLRVGDEKLLNLFKEKNPDMDIAIVYDGMVMK